jgi:glycosyltransferase involved in cell wall biosynthesis
MRTLNLARLTRDIFNDTTVFSMDNRVDYEGYIDGIRIVQEKELHSVSDLVKYYSRAITAKELIVPYTKRAFENLENVLFQIEDPLLYPLLKKERISRFILDEHNVNWDMFSLPQSDLKKRIYAKIAYRRDMENEKQALLHAVHILCCSIRDRDTLVGEVPEIKGKISVIPNCVNIRDYDTACLTTGLKDNPVNKKQVLFVGTLSHQPNADAVRLICKVIAPHCPDCVFIIIGKNPPEIPYPDNVKLLGYVPDVRPLMAGADIRIAPIRSGSGTRLKILEYMAMGKPVISTSKGAEGIEYMDGLNIVIEDEIGKYPKIIQQLIDDDKKCSALGRESVKLIREKYDWELYRKPLERIFHECII